MPAAGRAGEGLFVPVGIERRRAVTGGRVSLQNLRDCRDPEYAASLRRLAALDVDALFPGHHEISLARAGRHLAAARGTLARGPLPMSTT
ncbi:hypothetical protein PV755_38095 [Streptomyces caniscabiei]|uniref:Uncharacterized protein n=2 Tax=Streptomyces caniscabiei TaxID=2746961 RepID=A0A927LC76_9ACTN|nr:hypothetical protein [Streptomyces caniscabiei]MBD9729094.1 hypothetical protein [Streptomyces caniscabiei]MDX3514657.1 hypothetical protein [Streptomyces caniscabiei]MDX3723933.1 hypothetical protein [Streptomyces caniscabiei]WEO23839.1 hypothetical protein IHE65_11990 [Streptomyces caniscabiei]